MPKSDHYWNVFAGQHERKTGLSTERIRNCSKEEIFMESRLSSRSGTNRSPLKIDATCSNSGNNAIPDTSVSSTARTSRKVDAKPNSQAKNRRSLLKSLFPSIKDVAQKNNEAPQHSPGNKRDYVAFGNVGSHLIGWAELAETIGGIVYGKQAVQDRSKDHGLVPRDVEIMAEYAQANQLTYGFRPVMFWLDSQNDKTDPSQNFPSVIFVPVDLTGAQS